MADKSEVLTTGSAGPVLAVICKSGCGELKRRRCVWRIADLCRKSVIRHTQVRIGLRHPPNEILTCKETPTRSAFVDRCF
jgi:hypothetical protein